MTQEEKAKAYDEALKVLHKYDGAHIMFTQDLKEEMFPELKESEDGNTEERIRKALIKLVTNHASMDLFIEYGIHLDEALAWLEKQGEQKPTDKIELKFKVGNWVVNTVGDINQIVKVWDNGYTLDNDTFLSNSWATEHCHRWTIQDAKDGDVLSYVTDEGDLWIMIYWSLYEPYEGHVHYHALLVNDNFSDKGTCCICIDDLIPATKEQRDLFFQKMKEAGLEWNAENKELKEIEKKSAENEELTEFDKAVGVSIGTWNPKTPEQIQSVKAVSKKLLKLAKKQINDEQNPAWSEEDEKLINSVIELIDNGALDRDEKDYFIEKLKFLKERYTWKPSEEQMATFWDVICDLSQDGYKWINDMNLLYQDLKKLREK